MKYNLYFQYDGFTLLHQNADKPILKKENGQENFDKLYEINSNRTTNINNQWRNILYTEKKGFFQKDSDDSCGYIENFNIYLYKRRFGELTERREKSLFQMIISNIPNISEKKFLY